MFSKYIIAESKEEAIKKFEEEFIDNVELYTNIKSFFEACDEEFLRAHLSDN